MVFGAQAPSDSLCSRQTLLLGEEPGQRCRSNSCPGMLAFLEEEVREKTLRWPRQGHPLPAPPSLQGDPSSAWAHLPALTGRPSLSGNREAAKGQWASLLSGHCWWRVRCLVIWRLGVGVTFILLCMLGLCLGHSAAGAVPGWNGSPPPRTPLAKTATGSLLCCVFF